MRIGLAALLIQRRQPLFASFSRVFQIPTYGTEGLFNHGLQLYQGALLAVVETCFCCCNVAGCGILCCAVLRFSWVPLTKRFFHVATSPCTPSVSSPPATIVIYFRLAPPRGRLLVQKSLKFTTLVHGLVTRYGPQLKPFLPALKSAIGRCSTFMVKAVMAALQRLDKK